MAEVETYNTQTKGNGPAIFELLSELEKRDKANKGEVYPGVMGSADAVDPRGLAVVNRAGGHAGKVTDLYVDPHDRRPHFALVSLGDHPLGLGNRQVLVGFSDLEITGDDKVMLHVAVQ